MTHYETLGIKPTARLEDIRSAYKSLAQLYHPDRVRDLPEHARRMAEDKMKAINEAYTVLSDPARRKAYDLDQVRQRFATRSAQTSKPAPKPVSAEERKAREERLRQAMQRGEQRAQAERAKAEAASAARSPDSGSPAGDTQPVSAPKSPAADAQPAPAPKPAPETAAPPPSDQPPPPVQKETMEEAVKLPLDEVEASLKEQLARRRKLRNDYKSQGRPIRTRMAIIGLLSFAGLLVILLLTSGITPTIPRQITGSTWFSWFVLALYEIGIYILAVIYGREQRITFPTFEALVGLGFIIITLAGYFSVVTMANTLAQIIARPIPGFAWVYIIFYGMLIIMHVLVVCSAGAVHFWRLGTTLREVDRRIKALNTKKRKLKRSAPRRK